MNLLNLAPEIQEEILFLTDEARGKHRVWEASVRTLSCEMIWSQQREQWKKWSCNRPDSLPSIAEASREVPNLIT